jgi:DsbC/DsbD-like thiol-disulfide interchange protein
VFTDRRRYRVPLLATLLAATLSLSSAAENKVKTTLLADHTQVEPGGTVRVGVLFRLPERAHIYWRNPGDSGLATGIEWTAPAGVTPDLLEWPTPVQFNTPGLDDINYGYTGEVLLFAKFSIDESYQAETIKLSARAYWLLCEDDGVCTPEESTLTLELDVGEAKPAEETKELFDDHARQVPGPYAVYAAGAIDPDHALGFNYLAHSAPLKLDDPLGLIIYANPPWQFIAETKEGVKSNFFPEEGTSWSCHLDIAGSDADVPDTPRALEYEASDVIQFYSQDEDEEYIRGVLTLVLQHGETGRIATVNALVPAHLLPHP